MFADYLDAEVRGRHSHGFVSFDVALSAFPKHGVAEVAEHGAGVITITGNGDCGHTVLRAGIDAAVPHMDEQRLYAIGVGDVTRVNCPGVIARYGAQHGCITLVFEYGGKNFLAPTGGIQPALSTNPLSIGIPGTDPLFLLDFATSERAIGYVALARMNGTAIPPTWGIDTAGESTSDPRDVAAVLPFGGYKGYGLSLAIELLAGALVGVPVGTAGSLGCRGALVLLLAPTIFGQDTATFAIAAQNFLDEVIGTQPIGEAPVQYPGQRSDQLWQQAMASQTVALPMPVWRHLENVVRST